MGLSVICDDCYEVVDAGETRCPYCHNGKYANGDLQGKPYIAAPSGGPPLSWGDCMWGDWIVG